MKKIWLLIVLITVSFTVLHAQEPFLDEEDAPPPPELEDDSQAGPNIPPPPSSTNRRRSFGSPKSSGGPANQGFNSIKKRKRSMKFADANPEDITNQNFPELIDSFDFPNADIADVIKAISELTGKNFIVDPAVRGKITIIAPTRVTVAEAYKAFLSALAIAGYTVVPSGRFLKIKNARQAQTDGEIYSGPYTPNTDQMITRIIQLKYIQAADVNKFLRTLVSKEGNFITYEPTNTLILSDYGSNISRVQQIIDQIDVSSFDEQLSVIPIRFAKAKDIAELIEKIINKGEGGGKSGTFRSGIPRFRRNSKTSSSGSASAFSLVIPDERTNTIIVVGNKAGIKKIKKLVAQLDFEIRPEDAGGVYVYYVKHGEAKSIADTLNGVAKNTGTGRPGSSGNSKDDDNSARRTRTTTPQPTSSDSAGALFGGEVKLVADEQTNSLIISASRQDYEVVLNLLSKVDIPRDQVFVEAIIMEMEVNDSLNYGISILGLDKESNGVGRVGFADQSTISNLLNVAGSTGAVLGFATGDDVTITGPDGGETTVKSLLGFINFLKTVTNTNILSTPQILALDNEEAEIEVGDRIPVARNSETGTNGTTANNIQFEDATIKLKIKPFISPDRETVRMNIDQQVKQLANRTITATNLAGDAVSTTTRSVKSNVVVRNGDTVVIGGLMKDNESPTVRKVPLLGDIPILGWLFKTKTIQVQKQNLLVFLTPRIIRTRSDARKITDRKVRERLQFIKDNYGGKDAHGRKVEEIRKANLRNPAADDLMDDMTGEM